MVSFRKKKKKKTVKPVESSLVKPPKEAYAPAKFFPAKNVVAITTETSVDILPCNVYLDETIRYELPKHLEVKKLGAKNKNEHERNRQAFISRPPQVLTIPFRKCMPTKFGRVLAPEYMRFHVYFVDPYKDITLDPSKEKLPDDIVKGLRVLLQSKAALEEFDVVGRIAKGQKDEKGISDYIWPILFVIQTVAFLLFYVLVPMWFA